MNNNNNLKKLLFIGLLIGTGITAAIVWIYVVEKKEETLSFSDFIFYCKKGNVKQVIIYDNYLKAALDDGSKGLKFYIVKFHNNYTSFINEIREYTTVTFTNTKTNSLVNAIINVIMQCLMLFLTLYILRKTMNPDTDEIIDNKMDDKNTPLLHEVVGFGTIKDEIVKILKYWTRIINDKDYQQDFLLTILFKGDPGTGKTFLANIMAKTTNSKFLKIDLSSIGSPFIHQTSRNIQKTFDKARELAQEGHTVIVFMDEIDSIMPSRSSPDMGWSSKENTEVITTILKNISGARSELEKKIMVIGATNHDNLDAAFHSRVSASFDFVNPDYKDRYELVNFYIKNEFKHVEFPQDYGTFINLTSGKSQRTLKTLLLNASVQAQYRCKTIDEKPRVTIDDLFEVLITSSRSQEYWVSDDEKMSIAMHEAGHALLNHFLYYHNFLPITVAAIGMTAGKSRTTGGVTFFTVPSCAQFHEDESYRLLRENRYYALAFCIVGLGGKIGEMYYFNINKEKPDSVIGWTGDLQTIIGYLSHLYGCGIDLSETKKIIMEFLKVAGAQQITAVVQSQTKGNYLLINGNGEEKINIKESVEEEKEIIVDMKNDDDIKMLMGEIARKDILRLAVDGKEVPLIGFNFNGIFKEFLHRAKQSIENEKKIFFLENLRLLWFVGNVIGGKNIDVFVELSNHCKDRLITCDSKFFEIMDKFTRR
jgi:AAA+ superfamily predicted ATPase